MSSRLTGLVREKKGTVVMMLNSMRGVKRWSSLTAASAVAVVLVSGVGLRADASTGGFASAQAAFADTGAGNLTLSANATGPFFAPEEAAMDGDVLTQQSTLSTDLATTPGEPVGADPHAVGAFNAPAVNPAVSATALVANTVRTDDALTATSTVAEASIELGSLTILSASGVAAQSSAAVVGDPAASTSMASLSIGGLPMALVPNVPIDHDIPLGATDVLGLIASATGNQFPNTIVTSGDGLITVHAESLTNVQPDGAQAIGLIAEVSVNLHVTLVSTSPDAGEDALELVVVGHLADIQLAQTEVLRPEGPTDPSTTTTMPDTTTTTSPDVGVTTTTDPGVTTTSPGATTTEPGVTTTQPGVPTTIGGQLPQTGSTSLPAVVLATVLLGTGVWVMALTTRRR